jgi:hypothetical protein
MKIVFFGASITAQKEGYVKYFKDLDNSENIIQQSGYGSMHLYDAGMIYINTILDFKPDICFIDWFSTGFITYDPNIYLNTIINKFSNNNCKLIFLFFPRNPFEKSRKDMYNIVQKYLNLNNINYLDISNEFADLNNILRDTIHTNDNGSKQYANKIYNYFNKIKNNLEIPLIIPNQTKFCDIKEYKINNKIYKNLIITGNIEIIGISQQIGPHSGLINIITDDTNTNTNIKLNLWDQWCHYERTNIKISIKFTKYCKISICSDDFDRSSCTRDIKWNEYQKYLDFNSIYYIGEEIKKLELELE